MNNPVRAFLRRVFSNPRKRSNSRSRRHTLYLEPLEKRLLLSVTLVGIPDWVEQGPGPENNGGAVAAPNNAVNGATEVFLAHPTIANMAFAGTVAGGVWRTADITGGGNPANIVWEPLTDLLPSLYVGAMAFDPSSPNTLYVGTGSYSNTFRNQLSETALGLYRTTNANAPADDVAWENLGATTFANLPIRRIAVSPTDPEQILVAADDGANGGLFRSLNGGADWTELSAGGAPGLNFLGGASDVVRDPNRNDIYYVAAPGAGVFRSDDNGDNWTRIDNLNTAITGIGGSSNIEIALHDTGPLTVIYVGVVDGSGALSGVFRYAENGIDDDAANGVDDAGETTWAAIGAAPPAIHGGGQGFNNFSIVADPTNANLVYVGGDRPPDIFRGDAGANTWTDIGAALLGTRPHADSRALVFLDNTTLIETDDGGIFRLTNPAAPGGADDWVSLNANLRAIEFHAVAYDTAANLIFGGSQDNGSAVQTAVGSLTWDMFQGGDGSTQTYSVPGNIRYSLGNTYGSFTRGGTQLQLRAPAGVANFDGLENVTAATGNSDQEFATAPVFESRLPAEANRFNANDLLFGRRALYESTNQGDNITIVINPTDLGKGATERFVSLVYGGVRASTNFANVFWAGTEAGRIYIRDEAGTITDRTADLNAVIAGSGPIHDIAVDPDDYRRAYALKGDRVAFTTDSGDNWTEVTDNLGLLTTELRSLAFVDGTPGTAGDGTVVAGGLGGVFRRLTLPALGTTTWSEFGIMPNSVVQDMDFVAVDPDGDASDGIGILLAGSFGRGAWTISDVSAVIDDLGVLQIVGDTDFAGEDDVIKLVRQATMPNLLDVFLNSITPVMTVELSLLHQINVFSLGGNDTLIAESTNGLINVPLGTRYDGGAGVADQLQLLQTEGPALESDTYSVGPDIGAGVSTIVGEGTAGTQTVFFENLSPVLDLVPAPLLTVNATPEDNAIAYVVGSVDTQGLVTIDEHESIEFANKIALTLNAGGGTDTVSLNDAHTPTGLTDITVDGGDPSGGDALVVTGGGDVLYTPTASDGGTLNVSGLPLVTIARIEELLYDGDADVDSLTVAATGSNDVLVHTPGANDQAGSFQVNSLLALSYQNLGGAAILTADGAGGADTLIYNGTAANDTFTVGAAGQVLLNSRLVVNTSSVEALTLEGFGGDDSFTLVPAISDMVYATLNLNGGAGADRVDLEATVGNDNIVVSGQTVALGAKTVVGNSIEDIRLDALLGNDLLIYTGVSGVTEDITVGSSGVVGGGQVSVPGVTLVNFSNVERIDVNGNTPTPTEKDSLTFAGTNAVDNFQINLAAAGVDADPILTLQNASLVTLLTLRNYTNFDTLRVLGLDGADTFNVATDPATPVNRNLFVDGGLPAGKKKSTDKLNVFYTAPRPKIIQSAATQDPDAGLVDLDYGSARFLVQYDGIEQMVIRKI